MAELIYKLKEVGFRYERDWTLKDIHLTVHRGEFIGIIGPNGSGKTSLLKAMAALLRPEKGLITFFGQRLETWPRRDLARTVAVVPQESLFLYPYTVLEVVLMGRWPHTHPLKFEGPEDFAIGHEMLFKVDLDTLADRSILALSGGERQRAVIARALAQQPQVLLLDEPTAFLDLSHQLQIYHILKQLNQEKGLTIIVVSHDLNLAAQFCHQVVLMNHGQVVRMGSCEDVITAPLVEEIYGCRTLVDSHPTTGKPRVTLIPWEQG